MKYLNSIVFILLFSIHLISAQNQVGIGYIAPIVSPYSFSGGFAELRTNHFHGGLDFRTGGENGKSMFAVKDGYVSRIGVSPVGYGNALYINHDDGTTSVYGHLERFRSDIQSYVKEEQYKQESFSVNIVFDDPLFYVKQGEVVAYSGNTGSSGGPHLHFEMRETLTQNQQNPIFYNLGITDKIAPEVFSLYIYPLDSTSHVNNNKDKKRFEIVKTAQGYTLKGVNVVDLFGKIGFGIEAFDKFNASDYKCGVFSIELTMDGQSEFGFKFDHLSFDFGRYSNSHADYEERIKNNKWVHRLYKLPGNKLDIYQTNDRKGMIMFDDNKLHQIEIIVKDAFNNMSRLNFKVRSTTPIEVHPKAENATLFRYDQVNEFIRPDIHVVIAKNVLYEDVEFKYKSISKIPALYSDIHQIHLKTVAVHNPFELSIRADQVPDSLIDKALIASVDPKTGKIVGSEGGVFADHWITSHVRQFGYYAIAVDTIPPQIIPLTVKNTNQPIDKHIKFKIYDDMSGIKSYRGEIDGKWALFEYDAKTSTISYAFDDTRHEKNKEHLLRLLVTDQRNNISEFKMSFKK